MQCCQGKKKKKEKKQSDFNKDDFVRCRSLAKTCFCKFTAGDFMFHQDRKQEESDQLKVEKLINNTLKTHLTDTVL